mgnify:CR=1 FL=1
MPNLRKVNAACPLVPRRNQQAAVERLERPGIVTQNRVQRRDLFQPAFELRFGSDVKDLQPWLNRVIWKGDFAIHYAVTGAALKFPPVLR